MKLCDLSFQETLEIRYFLISVYTFLVLKMNKLEEFNQTSRHSELGTLPCEFGNGMDPAKESGHRDGSFHVPFTETDVQSFLLLVFKETGGELYHFACFVVIHGYASVLTMTKDVIKGKCLLSATFDPVHIRAKLQEIKMLPLPPKILGNKVSILVNKKKNGFTVGIVL